MSEKLLSIILPAYNAEKQLKELLTAYFAVNRTILSLLLLTTDQRTPQMILSEAITIRDFLWLRRKIPEFHQPVITASKKRPASISHLLTATTSIPPVRSTGFSLTQTARILICSASDITENGLKTARFIKRTQTRFRKSFLLILKTPHLISDIFLNPHTFYYRPLGIRFSKGK